MGIGTRDESTGEFFHSKGLAEGHWYTDEEGLLYIVPDEKYGLEEIAGPDNDTTDQLNAAYRETDFEKIDPDELAKKLGLDFISYPLRRFDRKSGFYSV